MIRYHRPCRSIDSFSYLVFGTQVNVSIIITDERIIPVAMTDCNEKGSFRVAEPSIRATIGLTNAKLFATNSEVLRRSHTNIGNPTSEPIKIM